jgi:dolichyl-phosphate beta-glucosyltransferase
LRRMEAERSADSVCLVVPCFNECARLGVEQLRLLAAQDDVSVVLVDDGSTDGTLDLLRSIQRDTPSVTVVAVGRNVGKGEAVRAGLTSSAAQHSAWVGYLDADLSTPVSEIVRLVGIARARTGVDVIMGSRVALLGRDVQRSAFRHYTGRVFATFASIVLRKPVYDTQCGAKLFRRTEAFARSVEAPFHSRWAFDVELLGRLDRAGVPAAAFWEEPLLEWHDVSGSRRTLRASLRASADLLLIRRALGGRR